jgi:L-lactate permease
MNFFFFYRKIDKTMKNDLISVWFPSSFLNLFTLLLHIQKELAKKTGLNDTLHKKFGEVADALIKLKLMFAMIRSGMPQRTQNALKQQFSQMDKFGVDVCMGYIGTYVTRSTTGLEEKINDMIKFCESQQTLQGAVPCT